MTLFYIDSSTLVSMAYQDKRGRKTRDLLREKPTLYTSQLAIVECQAGILSQSANRAVQTQAEQNLNRIFLSLCWMGLSEHVFGVARTLIKQYRLSIGLRSADAIHIATANLIRLTQKESTPPLKFLTSDQKQYEAFTAEGHVGYLID